MDKRNKFFQKRIIRIPIQQGIHWSLCVVINPGKIKNNTNSNPDDERTYMLFFDSLKLHGKLNILKNIQRWLNNVYKDKNSKDFKEKESCTIFDKVQIYQPNGKWYIWLNSRDNKCKLIPFTNVFHEK